MIKKALFLAMVVGVFASFGCNKGDSGTDATGTTAATPPAATGTTAATPPATTTTAATPPATTTTGG